MELRKLRHLRRVFSLILLAGISALFLDPWSLVPPWMQDAVTAFQFLPALMKTLAGVGLWTAGAVAVLVLTLLVGRVYCSTLCPLGTYQDLIIALVNRRRRVRRFRYEPPPYLLHYAVLGATVAAFVFGSMMLFDLLEPFSVYGRLVHGLARPLLVAGTNTLALILASAGVYAVDPLPPVMNMGALALGTVPIMALVTYLASTRGRLFCNSLCPVGAVLGILARFSLLRIVIDPVTCTECGLCEKVCKASCIDSANKRVDYQACVSCFNCLHACPTVGLVYTRPGSRRGGESPAVAAQRRQFLAAAAAIFGGVLAQPSDSLASRPAPQTTHPVTPPGSLGIEHFTGRCTACHLCVSVCPTQVLQPSLLDYGIGGIFQPKMDYHQAYCLYECVACTSACPSGAIMPMTVQEKKRLQLGRVRFLKDECIVITKKTDCGACAEHCPTKAVRMVPYERLRLPETNEEICVGCGACEKACPTTPQKAIYVEALHLHAQAKEPPKEEPQPEAEPLEEFPF
jgi:ferredoxin